MDEQKILVKRRAFTITAAVLAAAVVFLFLKWLYTPVAFFPPDETDAGGSGSGSGNAGTAVEVFNYDIEKRLKLAEMANNPYIQILNSTIPSMKASYEQNYGYPMPGMAVSALSRLTDGLHTDLKNPITYFNLAFTAFSQYNPAALAYAGNSATPGQDIPEITDFGDAPEGAIYFSEEDEYTNGDAQAAQEPGVTAEQQEQIENAIDATVENPGKIELAKSSPQVLIYHTHATESYMPNTSGNYHTLNEKYSVIAVGNTLTKRLQDKYKYRVVHDKTLHDKESYAYSYANSLLTIKKNLSKYDTLKVILDIHRDAFSTSGTTSQAKKNEYTATINGKKAARIMLVIGKGNPNYKELEKFAVYIKKKMDTLYPGLFLRIDRKEKSKYNQYFSNHSMLIEVGCMLNTCDEAEYSGQLLGDVLGEVMKDLGE